MPRPPRFDRDEIVAAALTIARRDGLAALSARSVAKELGASTSVIYARFDSIDALRDEAIGKVLGTGTLRLLAEVQVHGMKPVVAALCTLGRREPWILEVMDTSAPTHPGWAASRQALAQVLETHPRYAALSFDERHAVVSRVTVAAVGMAMCSITGDLSDFDEAYEAIVEPVIEHALRTRPTSDLMGGARR